MRQRVRDADSRQRRSQMSQLERFLAVQAKKKGESASPIAMKAALKMLGYLEEPKAVPTLLSFTRPLHPAMVRQEALIALRFCSSGKADAKLINALVKAAEDDDRSLAQTALITLASLSFSSSTAKRLSALVGSIRLGTTGKHGGCVSGTARVVKLTSADDELPASSVVTTVAR